MVKKKKRTSLLHLATIIKKQTPSFFATRNIWRRGRLKPLSRYLVKKDLFYETGPLTCDFLFIKINLLQAVMRVLMGFSRCKRPQRESVMNLMKILEKAR